jgi:alpha-beta hydrolase superfamily lysophospholipase
VTVLRRVAVAMGAAGVVAWTAGCAALHHRAMGRVRRRDVTAPADPGLPAERLEVRTSDGLHLLAWYLSGTRAATVVVSGGNRGWAGDVLGIATALRDAGFHVVVHGWRGTPGCDPAPHTLGVHERRDLEAVLDAARRRLGGLPLGLLGYSMGGAVAISVAGSDPRVAAVCTDCAFDDPLRVLGDGVRRVLRIPGPVLTVPVRALLALRTGARMTDLRPLRRVGEIAPRPLLLIHGGGDASVPPGHGRRLHAAAGPGATLWLLPGVGHCGGYDAGREEYVRRVTGFFEDALLA